ncbi:hypothetical protein VTI74DRAFT_6166 [Chaetomium olivicolor]
MATSKEFSVCKWKLKGQKDVPELSSEMSLTKLSEMVFDPDNRKPVAAQDYAVLKLHMHYREQQSSDKRWAAGSGWLIAEDHLLTAGHCVYDHVNRLRPATHIKAYVGYHGKNSVDSDSTVQMRYGKVVVTPSAWINGKVRLNDFAIVQLEKAFGEVTPINNGERGAQMYADFEQVSFDRDQNDGLLAYEISTYAGQSGSPVLRCDGNGSITDSIATHVAGSAMINFASPIAVDADNPYTAIVDYLRSVARMSQAAIDNDGDLPRQLPEDTGACERALIAESALQFLLMDQELPEDDMKAILKRTKKLYIDNYPFFLRAAPHLTKDLKESAVRVALDHIRRSEDKTLPSDIPSTDKKQLNPTDESAKGNSDVDSKTRNFRDRLLKPTYELDGEEGFFDVLGDVINVGMNLIAPPIVKLAPVALNLLSNVLKQESDMDGDDDYKKAQDKELTDLARRALLAEAALEAFIEANHDVLEEKGFFDFVKAAIQKVGGAVLANAPRMIDAAVPIVKSLLQPEQPGQAGQKKEHDVSARGVLDTLGDEDQSKAAPSEGSSKNPDALKGIKEMKAEAREATSFRCRPRGRPFGASDFVRTRYLTSASHLQVPREKKAAMTPQKADANGNISVRGVLFGDAGQDGSTGRSKVTEGFCLAAQGIVTRRDKGGTG